MIDKLIPTSKVAETLGLSVADVLRLVRAGKLIGVRQVVRGTGRAPRIFVKSRSLATYVASLPDAREPAMQEREPAPKPSYRGLPKELQEELARARSSRERRVMARAGL